MNQEVHIRHLHKEQIRGVSKSCLVVLTTTDKIKGGLLNEPRRALALEERT